MPSTLHDIDSSTESTANGYENSLYVDIEQNSSEKDLIDPELVEINPLVENDALNTIIKYYLDGEGHSSLTRELLKQAGLFWIAIGGVIFYYVPSKAYAESICADSNYKAMSCDFLLINHIAGTMLVAGGVLMSATNSFFDRQKAERIPIQLEAYLQHPLTPCQKLAENAVTYAGSFVASIPFMIITVVNPIPGLSKLVVLSQALMVGVTNTLLHLLPFKLALKNPLYRFPFLPIEFIIKTVTNIYLTKEEKQKIALQDSLKLSIQDIKQRMIKPLDMAQKLLSIYGFKFSGCHITNEVAQVIQENQAADKLPIQLLTQLLERLQAMSPDRPIPPSGRANNLLRKMIYIPGATWVILACAGFWGGTFNEMVELTGNRVEGSFVSAPSIYCLGVLLAFFGGNALQNTYDYLTNWKDDTVKIPMSFKLYPKTAVLLIIISMYLSAFSYSAGAQLINDNFKGDLEFLRPVLLELAKSGLIFLGFTAMVDFFNDVLKKFAQYGGGEDAQTVARLYAALNQMKDSIQLMKPDLLLESLAYIRESQLKSILAIKDIYDLQDLSVLFTKFAEQLKLKLFNEIESMGFKNSNEVLSKLCDDLKNDGCYSVSSINRLLAYFDEKPELAAKLASSFKQTCQEYTSTCKIMGSLDKLSLELQMEQPMNTFPRHSINNEDSRCIAGSSSEITPLIRSRTSGPIYANFYRPRYNVEEVFFSPPPTFSNSNHMSV